MGFNLAKTLSNGLSIEQAYFRIDTVTGNKESVQFSLLSYVSRDFFLEGKANLDVEYHEFVPDVSDNAPNLFRQAYAYLKAFENFADAVDVLEDGQEPINP